VHAVSLSMVRSRAGPLSYFSYLFIFAVF